MHGKGARTRRSEGSWRRKGLCMSTLFFFFSSRRRHTRLQGDWSSDVCSSDLNLSAAVKDAGISNIDLWQGGPESNVVAQARVIIPAFKVKYFQPHHLGTRATKVDGNSVGFSLEYGLHFPYLETEVPRLTDYLKSANAVAYNPVNYFDAWSLSKDGFKSQDNADV